MIKSQKELYDNLKAEREKSPLSKDLEELYLILRKNLFRDKRQKVTK